MLKNKLVNYFIKWILLFYSILTIINIVYYESIFKQIGLTLGCIVCFVKYLQFVKMFIKLIKSNNTRISPSIFAIIQYFLHFGLIIILMFVLNLINLDLNIGFITGILVGPTILFIICLFGGLKLKEYFDFKY